MSARDLVDEYQAAGGDAAQLEVIELPHKMHAHREKSGDPWEVYDEESDHVLTAPRSCDADALAAVVFAYRRGLQTGERAGRATLQRQLRLLLGAAEQL